jgi:hypothetical protein
MIIMDDDCDCVDDGKDDDVDDVVDDAAALLSS